VATSTDFAGAIPAAYKTTGPAIDVGRGVLGLLKKRI